jgi:hypothetical protein
VQFLLILRGAHLVLDGKGKGLRVVFDMHLLDRDLGVVVVLSPVV